MAEERPRPFSEHDLVESVENPGKLGLIDELGGGSISDYDSEEETEPLPGGHAIVIWDDGAEEQVELSALLLIDRGLAVTECAALASDPLGQIGVIERVEIFADIVYHTGDVVRNVSHRRLRWINQFLEGDYVVFDNWIGRVEEVVDSVTLHFDDGAKCKLRASSDTLLRCKTVQRNCEYFPGMKVSASSDDLKSATWLRGSWKRSRKEATILRVEPATIMVYWIAIGPGPSSPAPSTYQNPKDLIHLPQLSRERDSWRLGDWSLAPRDEEEGEVDVSNPEVLPESASHSRKRPAFKRRAIRRKAKKVVAPQHPVRVVRTQRFVDVLWQDGTRSLGIPAVSLDFVAHPGENDFLPEMYVVEGDPGEGESAASESGRVGIVKAVDAKQRTAKVKWFKPVASPEEMREFDTEETVSCYGISVIRAYEYALGDLVIRLNPNEAPGRNNEEQMQPKDDLSWLGSIVGFEDGDICVEWGSGDITKVGPNAIFVVDRNDHLEDGDEDDDEEDDDDTDSWETVDSSDNDELTSIQPEQFPGESQGGLLTLLFTSMSRLVSAIMGRAKKVVAVGERGIEVPDEEMVETYETHSQTQTADQQSERNISNVDSMECSASSALPLTAIKHFEVAKNPADHHYVNAKNEVPNQRKWLKKVNQEWSILQDNLPDTIYVVMYEDRMDLMRAIIVGAAGTPYHDGLFVFDIWLPADYPNIPPVVYYHSGGMRVNPNLYENGKVCLSLLNTWTGKGSELWNPGTSNVLQVLISIQGLVLNAKPYFNEAGYDTQNGTGEGEKNSIAYNENTFLLSCKNILNLLRKPPMHFEELIKSHFRQRGFKFLSTCKSYLQGVQVARFTDQESEPRESGDESSAGFKLLLRKLVPKLAEAFVAIGAIECREFLEVVDIGGA